MTECSKLTGCALVYVEKYKLCIVLFCNFVIRYCLARPGATETIVNQKL